MSGIHARRPAPDAIDSALQRTGTVSVPRSAPTPEPFGPAPSENVPFDGRARPPHSHRLLLASPLPTPDPDPAPDVPLDEANARIYRGIEAHLQQFLAPFGRTA